MECLIFVVCSCDLVRTSQLLSAAQHLWNLNVYNAHFFRLPSGKSGCPPFFLFFLSLKSHVPEKWCQMTTPFMSQLKIRGSSKDSSTLSMTDLEYSSWTSYRYSNLQVNLHKTPFISNQVTTFLPPQHNNATKDSPHGPRISSSPSYSHQINLLLTDQNQAFQCVFNTAQMGREKGGWKHSERNGYE